MKRETRTTGSALGLALVSSLIVVISGIMAPADAAAALRIQASINAPVRASVVVTDGPRMCTIPKPIERRTVVVRDCGCRHGKSERALVKHKHRRHERQRQVWVAGHWQQVSHRTARWIPGHWERI